MKRRNVRTLALVVVTFTYLLVGAAVFDVLEGGYNEASYDGLVKVRQDFIAKYNMTELDYKVMHSVLREVLTLNFSNIDKLYIFETRI